MIGEVHWTASEVRGLRDALQLSRLEFARLLQVDKRTVARWEDTNRVIALHAASRRLLDGVVETAAPGALARFDRRLAADAAVGAMTASSDAVERVPGGLVLSPCPSTEQYSDDGLRIWIDMNRRELMRLFAGVSGGLPAVAAMLAGLDADERSRVESVLRAPARVDGRSVDHIEAALNIALAQNDTYGPNAVLAMVLAQKRIAAALLDCCPAALEQRLLNLYSSLSQLAGWMQFDLRDFTAARVSYEDAREYAHRANNTDLAVLVLCNLSYLAIWQGNPRVGIDHAVAAQNWAARSSDHRLRAYAHDMAAVGYARDQQITACLDSLSAADAEIDSAATQDAATSVAYFAGAGLTASIRSECMHHLGEGARARDAAEYALTLIAKPFVRNRSLAHLDLATAFTDLGLIDQAADSISNGAQLAISCRSDRLTDQIRHTRQRLDPWADAASVRALDDELADYRFNSRT